MGEHSRRTWDRRGADRVLDEQMRGIRVSMGGMEWTYDPDTASKAERRMVRMAFRKQANRMPEA